MTSPSTHLSKIDCLTQRIMVVGRGQNNSNSLKIVLKAKDAPFTHVKRTMIGTQSRTFISCISVKKT